MCPTPAAPCCSRRRGIHFQYPFWLRSGPSGSRPRDGVCVHATHRGQSQEASGQPCGLGSDNPFRGSTRAPRRHSWPAPEAAPEGWGGLVAPSHGDPGEVGLLSSRKGSLGKHVQSSATTWPGFSVCEFSCSLQVPEPPFRTCLEETPCALQSEDGPGGTCTGAQVLGTHCPRWPSVSARGLQKNRPLGVGGREKGRGRGDLL